MRKRAQVGDILDPVFLAIREIEISTPYSGEYDADFNAGKATITVSDTPVPSMHVKKLLDTLAQVLLHIAEEINDDTPEYAGFNAIVGPTTEQLTIFEQSKQSSSQKEA